MNQKYNQQQYPVNSGGDKFSANTSNNERKHKWIRILLLTIVILVSVLLGIAELHTDNGLWWGIASAYLINGGAVLWSVFTTYRANRGEFVNSPFRLYYEWIHYFVEIVFVAVGYIILLNFEETWILLINLLNGTWPIGGASCLENTFLGKDSWDS